MKHPLSRLLAVFSLALPLCFAPSAGAQAPAKVEQFTLPNGLTVIVKPDRRAPTAVHMLWVRVGAMDEVDGTSGVAHVLEHMMFKGTERVPAGEFSRRVAALGGRENAFTARDYTGYYQQIPSARLEEVMQLEADRFANNRFASATRKNDPVMQIRSSRDTAFAAISRAPSSVSENCSCRPVSSLNWATRSVGAAARGFVLLVKITLSAPLVMRSSMPGMFSVTRNISYAENPRRTPNA